MTSQGVAELRGIIFVFNACLNRTGENNEALSANVLILRLKS